MRRALVVHGKDGLDEITITGPTLVGEVRDGWVKTYEITPEEFGLKRDTLESISGGDVQANAEIIREVLGGKKNARRDVVLLNAAAASSRQREGRHHRPSFPMAANPSTPAPPKPNCDALVAFTNRHQR